MSAPLRLACLAAFALLAPAAQAEVRFGQNVYIGGHDVSHQTFDRRHRGEYHLYNRKPHPEGCALRRNADGSQTKVCHLQKRR